MGEHAVVAIDAVPRGVVQLTGKVTMHVGAVLSPSTEARDVKLAQFPLLRQFNIMAKIAVVSLEERQNSEDWGREF